MNSNVRNKTYEEYFEEIKPDIYAHASEEISCPNNHYISKFICTCYVQDQMMVLDVENGNKNCKPDNVIACVICNSIYIKKVGDPFDRYGTGFQFWMYGEWRERKYK